MMSIRLNILALLLLVMAFSAHGETLAEWTTAIRSLCMAPDQPGKIWNVKANANAQGDVKVKLLGDVKADAGVTFTKGEWEGVQKVLEDQQVQENSNYRQCVDSLTTKLLNKISINREPDRGGVEEADSESRKQKEFLTISLGTGRDEVDSDGSWVAEDGKVYFRSSQRFMGFDFNASTRFKSDKASEAVLWIQKERTTRFYASRHDPDGKSTESGSEEAVYNYCFGSQYKKIISNFIKNVGAPTLPGEKLSEDKSGDLEYSGNICSYRSSTCSKSWTTETRTEVFVSDGLQFEFKASREYVSRSQLYGDISNDMSYNGCTWKVLVTRL